MLILKMAQSRNQTDLTLDQIHDKIPFETNMDTEVTLDNGEIITISFDISEDSLNFLLENKFIDENEKAILLSEEVSFFNLTKY